MRKLVLLLFLSVSMVTFAQKGKYDAVTFFGTDYSLVKVYGGGQHEPYQYQEAFNAINKLFIYEAKKYNVEKILGIGVTSIDLQPVEKQNAKIDLSSLIIDGGYGGHVLTDQQVQQAVKDLPLPNLEGVGLVVIAEVLNKSSESGTYKIVFFDIPTREVIEVRNGRGKAKGFGLRNHWAHSMLQAIKKSN